MAAVLFCLGAVLFFQHVPPALRWPVRVLGLASVAWVIFTTGRTLRETEFTLKKLVFTLILGTFFYLMLSLICHVFIQLMSQKDDRLTTRFFTSLSENCRLGIREMLDGKSYNLYDSEIGWVPRPGFRSGLYTINPQGIRGPPGLSGEAC